MDNIDVLLRAAEYIESKNFLVNPNVTKTPNFLHFNLQNNSKNQALTKNEQLYHKKINNKSNLNFNETKSDIYSSSLPSNFVSVTNFIEIRKNNETKLPINKSMSRLDEIKRDKATHNTLEKNRRAHLKGCFESLQNELPQYKDKKCTNLAILNYTLKYIEQSKKKDKENEFEKRRLLEEQIKLKKNLSELALDLKTKYLQLNASSIEEANIKFNSILNSLNINSDLFTAYEKNDVKQLRNTDQETQSDQRLNSFSKPASSPKQIVARYYRKRSSNSLSIITGIKTIQPSQSLQLHLQNQLKSQKFGKRLNGQNRHRHYSVDDNIMNKQQNRKKNVSSSINDFDFEETNHEIDDDEDDDDFQSADDTNTTIEFEIDSNSFTDRETIYDEASNGSVINKNEQDKRKLIKEENVDIETLSDNSDNCVSGRNSSKMFDPNNNLAEDLKDKSKSYLKTGIKPKSNETKSETILKFSNQNNSYYFNAKTSNLGYINTSLISNVQNLNLKTSIQVNSYKVIFSYS